MDYFGYLITVIVCMVISTYACYIENKRTLTVWWVLICLSASWIPLLNLLFMLIAIFVLTLTDNKNLFKFAIFNGNKKKPPQR